MIDTRYLERGLDGLARAHHDDYFASGHRAAAVVAGHFMCREQGLAPPVVEAIGRWLEPHVDDDPLFAPAPADAGGVVSVEPIVEALRESAPVLREVGHNVIFASLALKGLRALPAAATGWRVAGIAALPGRFRPTPDAGEVDPADVPASGSVRAFADFVCREFLDCLERFSGYGQGWAGHMLTIARALCDLVDLGEADLAKACHPAFATYVALARRGPGEGARAIPEHAPRPHTPPEAAYWRDRPFGLGHVLKYPYAFYGLIGRLDDERLRERCLHEAYRVL